MLSQKVSASFQECGDSDTYVRSRTDVGLTHGMEVESSMAEVTLS